MFNEQVVRKIAVFTQELREFVRRLRILSFVIIVRDIRCLSTIPGRHFPVFLVHTDFFANGAFPISLVKTRQELV